METRGKRCTILNIDCDKSVKTSQQNHDNRSSCPSPTGSALPGLPEGEPRDRLMTSLLDSTAAPAVEHQGAAKGRMPHSRQSFTAHVQLLRQTLPQSGAFPHPQQPMRRKRWFEQLIAVCIRLKATRTTSKRNKRMVERRNSPYASHDRRAPRHVDMDCTAVMLDPKPVTARDRTIFF